MNNLLKALYWPHPDDQEIERVADSVPCRAEVMSLSATSANLSVTDHFGKTVVRLNIPTGGPKVGNDWCSIV